MNTSVSKGPLFLPFPKETSTLLVSVSNGGKSYFLCKILQHADVFFEKPISKVYIVNHNKNVVFYDLKNNGAPPTENEVPLKWPLPPVEEYLLGEFNIINDAEPDSVVVFEDIQFVSNELLDTINLACHHKHLAHVFVVAQSVLGGTIFKLLSLVHRVVLFTSSGGIARLANYITQHFTSCTESKQYLKHILSKTKRNPFSTLQIEINSHQPHYLAITNLLGLVSKTTGYCLVYPKPGYADLYREASNKIQGMSIEWDNPQLLASALATEEAVVDGGADAAEAPEPTGYFIIHPAQIKKIVQQGPTTFTGGAAASGAAADDDSCLDNVNNDGQQGAAHRVKTFLLTNIDNLLKKQHHQVAKGLANELLANPDFCISLDGKRIKLKHSEDEQAVSTIDYIATASRPSGPSEQPNVHHKLFVALTESLLNNGAPRTLIKNKLLLLKPESTAAKRLPTKRSKRYRNLQTQHKTQVAVPMQHFHSGLQPFYTTGPQQHQQQQQFTPFHSPWMLN